MPRKFTDSELVQYIQANPDVSQEKAAESLGVSQSIVSRRLAALGAYRLASGHWRFPQLDYDERLAASTSLEALEQVVTSLQDRVGNVETLVRLLREKLDAHASTVQALLERSRTRP